MQRGSALIESTIALALVLFAALAALETFHWQMARQLAYVALTEAARAGAVGEARPQAMETAFTRNNLARAVDWHIQIVQPDANAYRDFGKSIRNDYQLEQHTANLGKWPAGKGPRSGLTIFQANTLRLRLRYLVQPWTPPLRALLKTLALFSSEPCVRRAYADGLLPLYLELDMDMQSSAKPWPDTAKVGAAELVC